MIDENAFGILIVYFNVEDDEYGLDRERFVKRFEEFRATVLEHLEAAPLGQGVRAVFLGHALYLEVAQGDEALSPLAWARGARQLLESREFVSVGVVTHGSRWVSEESSDPGLPVRVGDTTVLDVSTPSEPLRRALYAEAATHADEDSGSSGWGPGLYVDLEALEALELAPKNAPTPLSTAGATFYRAGA